MVMLQGKFELSNLDPAETAEKPRLVKRFTNSPRCATLGK